MKTMYLILTDHKFISFFFLVVYNCHFMSVSGIKKDCTLHFYFFLSNVNVLCMKIFLDKRLLYDNKIC